MSKTTMAIPQVVADAVRLEALRELRRPSEVLTEFLRWGWPSFVKHRLTRDLRPTPDPAPPEGMPGPQPDQHTRSDHDHRDRRLGGRAQ